MFSTLWTKIDGSKTYICCAVAIAALWSQVWMGTTTAAMAIDGTLAALTAIAGRHAISKMS